MPAFPPAVDSDALRFETFHGSLQPGKKIRPVSRALERATFNRAYRWTLRDPQERKLIALFIAPIDRWNHEQPEILPPPANRTSETDTLGLYLDRIVAPY